MVKKYKVILADPPWPQKAGRKMNCYKVVDGKQIWNSNHVKSEDMPYPTMTIDEIKAFPTATLADLDCALFCWATNANLQNALEVVKCWGFKYSTTIVWAKNLMGGGLGGDFRVTTEFLIYARRGKPKSINTCPSTWHNVKRTYENEYPKNSKKPIYFHELIESMFEGDKVELFARQEREGWDVFGNEVSNPIVL